MSKAVLLNNQDHQSLRYAPRFGAEFGHQVGRMLVFPNEIQSLHVQYPLLFAEGEEGLQLVALCGLEPDNNLFLDGDQWLAHAVPLMAVKGPFMIGFQGRDQGDARAVIHVDLSDSRLSETQGQPLFMPQGGVSPALDRTQSVLKSIDEGIQQVQPLVALLQEHALLEPISLDVGLADNSYQLEGYYTISQQRLAELEDDVVVKLHKSGALVLIHWLLGSLSNVSRLADLKQRQVARG